MAEERGENQYDSILSRLRIDQPTDLSADRTMAVLVSNMNQAALVDSVAQRFKSANRAQRFAAAMVGDVVGYKRAADERDTFAKQYQAQAQGMMQQAVDAGAQLGMATASNAQQTWNQVSTSLLQEQQMDLRKASIAADMAKADATRYAAMVRAMRPDASIVNRQTDLQRQFAESQQTRGTASHNVARLDVDLQTTREQESLLLQSNYDISGQIGSIEYQTTVMSQQQMADWHSMAQGAPWNAADPAMHAVLAQQYPEALQRWKEWDAKIFEMKIPLNQMQERHAQQERELKALLDRRETLLRERETWIKKRADADAAAIGAASALRLMDPQGPWSIGPLASITEPEE